MDNLANTLTGKGNMLALFFLLIPIFGIAIIGILWLIEEGDLIIGQFWIGLTEKHLVANAIGLTVAAILIAVCFHVS